MNRAPRICRRDPPPAARGGATAPTETAPAPAPAEGDQQQAGDGALFIRPYEAKDFEAAAHICRATLPPSLSSSSAAWRLAPYIWTHPYTHLSPSTSHVLDDGAGRAVGYCIGCPDVVAFSEKYASYVQDVLVPSGDAGSKAPEPAAGGGKLPWTVVGEDGSSVVNEQALLQLAWDVDVAVLKGKEDVWGKHRATMHIDLLEEVQGKGWGKKLIEAFVRSVRENKGGEDGEKVYGEGIHIGIAGDNGKVVPFYEKQGFRVVEGVEEGGITMVRDIE